MLNPRYNLLNYGIHYITAKIILPIQPLLLALSAKFSFNLLLLRQTLKVIYIFIKTNYFIIIRKLILCFLTSAGQRHIKRTSRPNSIIGYCKYIKLQFLIRIINLNYKFLCLLLQFLFQNLHQIPAATY